VRRLLLPTLAAALFAAAPAAAAPPWSAPQNVSSPTEFVDSPAIGFATDGSGLATWTSAQPGGAAGVPFARASLAPGAAAFGAEAPLFAGAAPVAMTPPVLYATNRTLAATDAPATAKPGERRVRVAAVYGRTTGGFGAPHTVAVRTNARDAQLAADADGDAAIAWFEDLGVSNDRVYVSFRVRGHTFGTPILLGTDRVRSVSVAVSPRGDVLVAWDARGTVRTRIKLNFHKTFSAVDTISSHATYYAALRTAMSANGRAFVAWGSQLLTEGGSTGPVYYEVAVRPSGASRFRAATLLEQDAASQRQGNLDLVVDQGLQRPTVAWTGFDGAHYIVRASTTDAGLHFLPAQNVSPPGVDASESALATSPDGRRLVAWVDVLGDAPEGILHAAVAPVSGAFGAPETVSEGPAARVPAAAFDAAGNRWALVWSNRPAGDGGPVASIKTYLQAALRPAA
jgi:hypothetical protein